MVAVVRHQQAFRDPVTPQYQGYAGPQQPVPGQLRVSEHPRQRPQSVAAQSRPLERFPTHRVGQQQPHETELQPDSLSPAQFAAGCPGPEGLIQRIYVNLNERQRGGENGGGSSGGKASFSPIPSSGKNLKIE